VAKYASSKKVGNGYEDLFRHSVLSSRLLSKCLEKLPIGFATVMTTHIAYDVYFDKLCDLLINRDKFNTYTLEDNDFTKRIIEIKLYLKGVRCNFVRDSSK
jgi:hypothetical protein